MKYYAYKDEVPNFGDELNHYLMPKIVPVPFDDGSRDKKLLLGIGSIIFDEHPSEFQKIVLGAGYGGYTALPDISRNWQFYAVRGPRTAAALGLDPKLAVSDLAVMIARERDSTIVKRHKMGFMPHYKSMPRADWQAIAQQADVFFIDPTAPVETVLREMQSCETIATEAMHGAIVADALRVPWIAFRPNDPRHRVKWLDWAESLDLDLERHPLPPGSLFEQLWNMNFRGSLSHRRLVRRYERPLKSIKLSRYQSNAARQLRSMLQITPQLSDEAVLQSKIDRFEEIIPRLVADHGQRLNVTTT